MTEQTAGAEGFYVTVIRNPGPKQRVGLLLGPFGSKPEAEGKVPLGKALALEADPFTAFDAFGVTRVVMPPGKDLPQGKLNGRDPQPGKVAAYTHPEVTR